MYAVLKSEDTIWEHLVSIDFTNEQTSVSLRRGQDNANFVGLLKDDWVCFF